MKKRIMNYLKKLQENEKKGFSLVELIIVMAIMAILVGIVASQVLPYMEKSRQSKDQQVLSSILTDVTSAISQSGEACVGGTDSLSNLAAVTNDRTVTEFVELRSGTDLATIVTNCEDQLKSKLMTGKTIQVSVDNTTGKIAVYVLGENDTVPSAGDKNYVETE